jgi:hypothetical protein
MNKTPINKDSSPAVNQIFLLPLFFENKTFAVFLAEPVSDILAATVTVTVFILRFKKILANGPAKK